MMSSKKKVNKMFDQIENRYTKGVTRLRDYGCVFPLELPKRYDALPNDTVDTLEREQDWLQKRFRKGTNV